MPSKIEYLRTGNVLDLPRGSSLPISMIENALQRTNEVFKDLSKVAPYVYELLGLRNLSSFVGAAFAMELQNSSNGLLMLNPHQDGYPDLLLLDEVGTKELKKFENQMNEKQPFSPFSAGGVEIKATVGDVPSSKTLTSKGQTKPHIGVTRVELISGINWKSHHRDTNHLLALIWDFKDSIPAIMVVSYSSKLVQTDWGNIVQPIAGGGRTTSVSIMSKSGVEKVLNNTLLIIDDQRYISLVEKQIKSKLNLPSKP